MSIINNSKEELSFTRYSRKNPNEGLSKPFFWKSPLEVLDLSLYPKKIWREKNFTPGNSVNLCDIPWKMQSQKRRPMEILH